MLAQCAIAAAVIRVTYEMVLNVSAVTM